MNKIFRKNGFTLTEMMIVVAVVVALVAIALPDMRPAMRRYRAREAIAALRSIEAHMRLNFLKSGAYNVRPGGTITAGQPVVGQVPGFAANDLNGNYSRDADYTVRSLSASTYTILFTGNSTGNNPQMAGIQIMINQNGAITETGY